MQWGEWSSFELNYEKVIYQGIVVASFNVCFDFQDLDKG